MHRRQATLALAATLLLVAGCGGGGETHHTVKGSVQTKVDLVAGSVGASESDVHHMFLEGAECSAASTGDLPGAQVVVKNAEGAVVASTQLDEGEITKSGAICTLSFEADLPDSDFYSFEIASEDPVTYSKDDLEAEGWSVVLTYG